MNILTVSTTGLFATPSLMPGMKLANWLKEITGINKLKNYLADSVMDGIVGWVYDIYGEAGIASAVAYTEKFSPDISTFIEYAGSMTHYQEYMELLASTLALSIFIFYIALVMLKKIRLADIQETLPSLVGKLILVLLGISYSFFISDELFNIMNSAWKALQEYGFDTSVDFAEAMVRLIVPISLASSFTSNNVLQAILTIVFGIIFIKQFINLLVEVMERYIVACLLKYSFSLPLSTCVTKNTSAVFKKYLQMYLCQLLMLALNTILINMVLRITAKVENMENFVGWLFMFAFMKVCQKIDGYLFTMGLSVAVTGGNVADQIGQSLRGMVQTARTGGRIASTGAELGAVGLRNMATANDNISPGAQFGMLKAAGTLGNAASALKGNFGAMHPNDVSNTIQDTVNTAGVNKAVNFAKNLTPEQVDSSMINDINSGNKAKMGIYNSMSEETKRTLANQSHNLDAFVPQGASVDNLQFGTNGVLKGRMSYQDASGIHHTDFEVSKNANAKSMQEDNGFYFSSTGGMSTGETVGYSNDNNGGVTSAEILMGKTLDNVSSSVLNNTQSITRTEDGFVLSKGVTGDSSDIIARMTDKGEVYYAQDTTLTSSQLESRPWAKDLQNVRMHNNGDGTIDVIGQQVKSHGTNKDELEYRNFRLYNRALYDDKSIMNADKAKYIGSFNAFENSGAYMVGEIPINKKDESALAKIQNQWEDYSTTIKAGIADGSKL